MLGRDTPIVLDKDEIFRDPKAVAVEWLQKYKDLPRPPYATDLDEQIQRDRKCA